MPENELYHYGKLGMKWGHHRTQVLISKNSKLKGKQEKYLSKHQNLTRLAEKAHVKYDLANSTAILKKIKYDNKNIKVQKKIQKTNDPIRKAKLQMIADKYSYKSSVEKKKADEEYRSKPYGIKATKLLNKSNEAARLAERSKALISKNEYTMLKIQTKLDNSVR